ncbi:MAG: TonB-dependent receptor [Acidobacteriota bacterium]
MRSLKRSILMAMAGVLLPTLLALAQFNVGRISGTIYDQTGAVVPDATVVIRNTGTGQEATAKSDAAGNFSVSALPFGTYVVSGTAPGFDTAVTEPLSLNVGSSVNVTLRLPVGAEREEVTVTGTTASVQTSTTELGNTLSTRQVENLPLNGRDVMDFISLVPGSVQTAGFGQTSLNGMETSFTGINTLLDGADATRIDTNATLTQFGSQTSRISRASVDSIAEVRILQTGYNAEYGRSIGSVVNLITKSGTNELHGGIFEFFRNDALNARNFFEATPNKQPFKLNQFGGNVGGPIVRNKLFFFGNYEGVRQRISNSFITTTLSQQERDKFVPSMRPYVDALVPLPPNPVVVPGTFGTQVFINASLVNKLREDTGSIKIDHNISDKDRWNLRYNINDSLTSTPFGVNRGQTSLADGRNQLLRLDHTHVFSPTFLNQFGVAINRVVTDDDKGGDGLPLFSNFANVGSAPGPQLFSVLSPQTSFQFLESATKTSGKHSLKFGADIRRNRSNRELRRQFIMTFFSLSDLQNNQPFALQQLGYPMIGARNTNWNFYVQDDWKVSSRLTLNLGLRYEYNSVLNEVNNRLSNFDIVTQRLVPGTNPLYNPDRNNFAPRFGFSYDPFGKGKTVIRGGGGVFYLPQLTGAVLSLPGNDFPNVSVDVFSFPNLKFPPPDELPSVAASNVNAFDPNVRDTYSIQWNLNIQHEILPSTVAEIGYVGNRGLKLPAGAAFAGLQLNQIDVNTGQRPFPNFGDERFLGNFLSSRYHALQASLRRRASSFTFDANYTWSHVLDNTVNIFNAFQDSRDVNADWSHGDTDVRHVFTADALYDLPELRNSAGPVKHVFGGWQVNTILQARSGLPVNIAVRPGVFGADPLRPNLILGQEIKASSYRLPDVQLNPAAFAIATTRNGNLQRNAARGPGFFQWDFSLLKNTKLNERYTFQFRADLFNILNHPNFANPDPTLCNSLSAAGECTPNPTFGRSLSTVGNLLGIGTSRQVQFVLKFLF